MSGIQPFDSAGISGSMLRPGVFALRPFTVLACYYSFTPEKLDFILNCKYRLGSCRAEV
jgi:hypothetical protein